MSEPSKSDPQISAPCVQVLGDIAIHRPGVPPAVLRGSSRSLLALLVAAGESGVGLDLIATMFWGDNPPGSWHKTLTMSLRRLRDLLPAGWTIVERERVTDSGADPETTVCLIAGDGWVDAWYLEELVGAPAVSCDDLRWIAGRPFGDEPLIRALEEAARSLGRLQAQAFDRLRDCNDGRFEMTVAADDGVHSLGTIAGLRILSNDRATQDAAIDEVNAVDPVSDTYEVTGDRFLHGPFVAFAAALPAVREQLLDAGSGPASGRAARAWRLLIDHFDALSGRGPQRLIIRDAHDLDPTSLELTTMLIRYQASSELRIVVCGSTDSSSPGWVELLAAVESLTVPEASQLAAAG